MGPDGGLGAADAAAALELLERLEGEVNSRSRPAMAAHYARASEALDREAVRKLGEAIG